MLIFRMLKREFLRKRSIFIVIFFFISLSAFLMANGASLIVQLGSSLDAFFEKAKIPHFVQMHSGEFDSDNVRKWSLDNDLVEDFQLVEMISLPGNKLFWGEHQVVLENSVMDISFVEQNSKFDYLLDLNNQVISLTSGQIGVPIYFRDKFDLEIGDRLLIKDNGFEHNFEIVSFVRDSQMNPAIIHSKRFVISPEDRSYMTSHFPEKEYLLEYRLNNIEELDSFSQEFEESGMPNVGPTLNIGLYKLLNSLSDGIVAGVVIIISLLVMLIAILCLRFIILTSLEEDLREIGVMKAIGIPLAKIKNIYNFKYLVMSYLAIIIGYLISLLTKSYLAKNLLLYTGQAPSTTLSLIIPFLASNLIIVFIALSLRLIIRKIGKISSVEAINMSKSDGKTGALRILSLTKNKSCNLELFLGARDIIQKFKLYWVLLLIFIFAVFIIVVPLNFYYTLNSPNFITYMGIGKSDIRIDLRNSVSVQEQFSLITEKLAQDDDVSFHTALITGKYKLENPDGTSENIAIETGDASNFPLTYLTGNPPTNKTEISISALNAQGLNKSISDTLKVLVSNVEKNLIITGIYQDITNGGKSAKALFEYDPDSVLWYTILINLKQKENLEAKLMEYKALLPSARVTDVSGYLQQTFGSTLKQVKQVAIIAGIAGLFISLFITLLFLKMVINKDISAIALMMSLGFNKGSIQLQYIWKTIILLSLGIVLGVLLTYSLGQQLISAFSSIIGIASFQFEANPLVLYLFLPLTLIVTVSLTTIISLKSLTNNQLINRISQ